MSKHIHVTQEQGKNFYMRGIKGEVVMLNLLKFKEVADYSDSPHLAPKESISGKAAYDLYMKTVTPLLAKAGSSLVFQGKGGQMVIDPTDEYWDLVLLVKHESVAKFMAFANDEAYKKIAGHRTAALEDSRLMPIEQF
ncbi:MAG: DUF1330 domain-containing protein [Saprospiraceae bacterium]